MFIGKFIELLVFHRIKRLRGRDVEKAVFPEVGGDFVPHYRGRIVPVIKAFELRRIEALCRLRSNVLLAIPIAGVGFLIIIYVGFFVMAAQRFDFPIIFAAVLVFGLSWWATRPIAKYKETVKEKMFPLIFEYFGKDFFYQSVSSLHVSDLESSGIIPSYHDEKTDDYIRGSYKGVGLEMVEARLTKEVGSNKSRRTVEVFKGIFVVLETNKKFKGKTLVKQDRGFFNGIVNAFQSLDRVKLEDPEFEEIFEVFSSDQVEARYLLTTSFMDRLKKLSELFDAKWVQGSFYDKKLLLMIPLKKDYFELSSIFEPATFVDDINRILEEMNTIFGIIDTLKLDEKTGL